MLKQKNLKRDKYRAVIIGAGRMGAQFDSPESKKVLTHAHAYYKNPRIELLGFYDMNKKAAINAAKKWHCHSYFKLDEMFKSAQPDIVSICTSGDHLPVLMKIVKYRPRLVICEKPLTIRSERVLKILTLYGKLKIPLLINYSRRFDKSVQVFKKEINQEKYGKILCASGIYTKGIIHNGSHLIDLCRYLFGEVLDFKILHAVTDYKHNDKSVTAFLKFEKCGQFYLMAGNEKKYSIFELDVLLERQRVRFVNSGSEIITQEPEKDDLYKDGLGRAIKKKTKLADALLNLIDNAIGYFERGEALMCDINEAMRTQQICELLLKEWRGKK